MDNVAQALYDVLEEAVSLYGKPGGPWNVPTDPGSWIAKAKKALKKARSSTKRTKTGRKTK